MVSQLVDSLGSAKVDQWAAEKVDQWDVRLAGTKAGELAGARVAWLVVRSGMRWMELASVPQLSK